MNYVGRIQCENMKEFLDVISGLVLRGVHFEANAERLEIKLTGAC